MSTAAATDKPAPLRADEASRLLPALVPDPATVVTHLADPMDPPAPGAGAGAVVVLPKLTELSWAALCAAGVSVVVVPEGQPAPATPPGQGPAPDLWRVADTRLAFARLSARLDNRPAAVDPGVHPSAVVHPSASLGDGVAIGPMVVIAAGASLENGVQVGAGSVVGRDVRIGAGSRLAERVVLCDGVIIGQRCLLQAGAVIGADGFGFAVGPRGAERVHHLGTVVIGDDVEVGANACVDRATLGATVIGDRSKLDNLVQVAHNVRIGSDVLMAGQTGVAGSTTIGDRVIVGGAASIADHLRLGDDVRIAGRAGVAKDVPAGAAWGGFPAQDMRRWLRERYLIARLEAIWAFVRGRA